MSPAHQKVYRVGIAPSDAPKDFLEHKIVLAYSVLEALDKVTQHLTEFLPKHEIRQVILVDVVDIP